jgi:hypothetical protein
MKDKFQILRDFANSNNKPNKTIYQFIKEVLDMNSAYAKENQQLKEQLLVAQTNEETFRLEMKDITKTLGLDENTLFDDVKVRVRNLKDNWNMLKEHLTHRYNNGTESISYRQVFIEIKEAMQVLEIAQELEGSDNQ